MPIKAEMRWFYPIDWPQISRIGAAAAVDGPGVTSGAGEEAVSAISVIELGYGARLPSTARSNELPQQVEDRIGDRAVHDHGDRVFVVAGFLEGFELAAQQ